MRILRKQKKKKNKEEIPKCVKYHGLLKQIIIKRDVFFSFGEFLAHRIVINHPQFSTLSTVSDTIIYIQQSYIFHDYCFLKSLLLFAT